MFCPGTTTNKEIAVILLMLCKNIGGRCSSLGLLSDTDVRRTAESDCKHYWNADGAVHVGN